MIIQYDRKESAIPTSKPKNPKATQPDIDRNQEEEEEEEEEVGDEPYDNDDMETTDYDSPVALKILQHRDMVPKKRKNDLPKFIQYLKKRILKEATELIENPDIHAFKIWTEIEIVYYKPTESKKENPASFIRTRAISIYNAFELEEKIENIGEQLLNRNANFMRNQSGLSIKDIRRATFHFAKIDPLRGGRGYVELPSLLKNKGAIINIQNNDNRCFAYALAAALKPVKFHAERPQNYTKYFEELGLNKLNYPIYPREIPEIEEMLQISINLYQYFDENGADRGVLYASKKEYPTHVDMLYWNEHYGWIKNFSRFACGITKKENKYFYCKRCLGHFTKQAVLDQHLIHCNQENFSNESIHMPKPDSTVLFTNIRKQQPSAIVIYADFEAITEKHEFPEQNNPHCRTHFYQNHKACSIGFKVISDIDKLNRLEYRQHFGPDSAEWFLHELIKIEKTYLEYIFDEKRLIMSEDDKMAFEEARECHICKAVFEDSNVKVRDHDHITGKFRGAAHQKCNLQLRSEYKIPVFFHNFRGYDSHLIAIVMNKFKWREIKVIGQGMEKYLTLNFGKHICFKDSLQFMSCSLDQLTKNLAQGGVENFVHTREEFAGICDTEEKFGMLIHKGVYPYDYMSNWDRFKEEKLPPREDFYSKLRDEKCTAEKYEFAQQIWKTFGCKTLKDYHDLYLKCDVLLLTDIFEKFRSVCKTNYDLDPAHYLSSPHLSWDAMLKLTKCTLELISDRAMFNMLEKGMRGGVCMISKRKAKANNKYLGHLHYDPVKKKIYIIYYDKNNLYGFAMSLPMPFGGFKWLTPEEISGIKWEEQTCDQSLGFIIECDIDYPEELHQLHNDYPLAPEKLTVNEEDISETQVNIRSKYNMLKTAKESKLVPNLLHKREYVCHYLLLHYYLTHGMKLVKIHRVIQFEQSRWLEPYIMLNQRLRAESKNDFEKEFFKLMNNSVYGKTCENQRKRTDIRLVNNDAVCKQLIEKSYCMGFRVFAEDLAGVELRKINLTITKPTYVGFTVLDLSKLAMYQFHYDYIMKKYGPDKAHLILTDTDSLLYEIETEDIYEDMMENSDEFDMSGFPKNSPFYNPKNNKVIGKMKDETNGEAILEVVALRPKMYSLIYGENKEKHRVKGVQFAASRTLCHADYRRQLETPTENYLTNRRLGSKLHRIYAIETAKRGLCSYDDKRFILEDGMLLLIL